MSSWGRIEIEGVCGEWGLPVHFEARGPWWKRRHRLVDTRTGVWLTPWLRSREFSVWLEGFCAGAVEMGARKNAEVTP